MSNHIGFVYVLTNPSMPGLFKIGCTEKSPHRRAKELSRSTGVPSSFEVLCYIEVADFQSVERSLHLHLYAWRINDGREFFRDALSRIVPWLYHHPERLAFCEAVKRPNPPLLLDPDLLGSEGWTYWTLPNPWESGDAE